MSASRAARARMAGTLWCLAAGAAGCQPEMEQAWQLRDFRVLGVQADNPQPRRGESVALTLVTVDVASRPVDVVWVVAPFALTPSGGGLGLGATGGGTGGDTASQTAALLALCLAQPRELGPLRCGPGTTLRFTVPETGGTADGAGRESLTVLGYACAGGRIGAADPATGLLFACTGAGARGWQFTHSLLVYGPAAQRLDPTLDAGGNGPNRNPEIAAVRFGPAAPPAALREDTPVAVPSCADQSTNSKCPWWLLAVDFTSGSRQRYRVDDPVTGATTERQERMTAGFIADRGRLSGGFRTDTEVDPESPLRNAFRAPAEPGPVNLFFYANDGRGGFAWTHRTLMVE